MADDIELSREAELVERFSMDCKAGRCPRIEDVLARVSPARKADVRTVLQMTAAMWKIESAEESVPGSPAEKVTPPRDVADVPVVVKGDPRGT
jgi:hypothetical protein